MIKFLEEVKIIFSVIQTVAIIWAAIWAYFRLKKERTHDPHLDFKVDCSFLGPENEDYLAEIRLVLDNKGVVRQEFKNIKLRVRGIKHGEELRFRPETIDAEKNRENDKEYRRDKTLSFPHDIIQNEVIYKEKYNYVFVEPNVSQVLNFVTKISKEYKYILIWASFHYSKYSPHSTESVFQVKVKD